MLQSCLEQDQLQMGQQREDFDTPTCDFDIRDVKYGSHDMTGAAFQTSTALSFLESLDPYWDSQLMMEYSKDLFTWEIIKGEVVDERFKVVDGVIYFHNLILLVSDSKLKEGLLDAIYEILLSKPTGFVKAYHTLLGGFIWDGYKEDVYSHMKKCMDYLVKEEVLENKDFTRGS